jgi:hypothetical protein
MLAVEFVKIHGVEVPLESKSGPYLMFAEQAEFFIGEDRRIKLNAELERSKDAEQLELVLRPRYFTDARGRNAEPLTVTGFNRNLSALGRSIHTGLDAFRSAFGALPQIQGALDRVEAEMLAMNRANNNENEQFQRLGMQRNDLMDARRNAITAIKRRAKGLPKSYAALTQLLAVARIANQLQEAGGLEYRLLARSGSRDIVLLLGNGQPPPSIAQAKFEIPKFPDVHGTWVNTKHLEVYHLDAAHSFTAETLDNPIPTHAGRWSRRENVVELSATTGHAASYELEEDIQLKGADHNLFRYWD